VASTILQNKMALEKERQTDKLNKKLAARPTITDLKMRNIMRSIYSLSIPN
jgi:hypothetical protein